MTKLLPYELFRWAMQYSLPNNKDTKLGGKKQSQLCVHKSLLKKLRAMNGHIINKTSARNIYLQPSLQMKLREETTKHEKNLQNLYQSKLNLSKWKPQNFTSMIHDCCNPTTKNFITQQRKALDKALSTSYY